MAGRAIYPARFEGGFPSIVAYEAKTGETFKAGALVTFDTGQVVECGADPTSCVGVALQPAFSGAGYDLGDSPTVITGRSNAISVALANAGTIFSGRGVNGGTDPVTPTAAHIGDQFGAAADSDGIWTLNIAETTDVVATVVDIDIVNKIFFFTLISV